MWKNKKLLLSIGVLSLTVIMLVTQGCGQTEDSDDSQIEEDDIQSSPETRMSENQERMLSGMNLDKVAEILSIGPQEVEDAFIQAQEEVFGSDSSNKREGWSNPEGLPSNGRPTNGFPGERPEGIDPPDGTEFPEKQLPRSNMGLPKSLIARMAEILDIDQQTLNNAFTQARSNDSE